MAGHAEVSSVFPCAIVQRGTGNPALQQRVGDRLAAAGRRRPRPAAGVGDTGELQRPDDVIFPLRDARARLRRD